MGTGERGWQECDGERRGRGRVLAVGRKHEENFRAANTAGNEGRSERVSYGVRFGAAQDRIEHTGTGGRGCPECDGERRGRGRSLAASTKLRREPTRLAEIKRHFTFHQKTQGKG